MPTPQEIAARNQANQAQSAEDNLYSAWAKEANKYDGTKPVRVRGGAGPIADAVVKRFEAQGWKVRNVVTGCRGLDEWELSA